MARQDLFALDLGTTKFCIGTILEFQGSNPSLQIVETPAKGMRRGMLADFTEAVEALNQLLIEAEKKFNKDIRKIVVGVAGSHLRSHIIEHQINLDQSPITNDHIQRLIEQVEQFNSDDFREVLHCIPIHFQLDDREAVQNPEGFSAHQVKGRFFVIDADRNYLKDIVRLCNHVGLEVSHLFSEPFASASVTVEDEHKHRGVALADIGGGTTDGLVFQNGRPIDVFTINIGGMMMTRDLAVGLSLPETKAEALKIQLGMLQSNQPVEFEEINIFDQKTTVSSTTIDTILKARILELGGFLAENLRKYKGQLGSGMLLTGGGANIIGLDAFLKQKFGIHVQKMEPQIKIADQLFERYTGRYATVIGLLNLELCRIKSIQKMKTQFWAKKYIDHFVNWIRELS